MTSSTPTSISISTSDKLTRFAYEKCPIVFITNPMKICSVFFINCDVIYLVAVPNWTNQCSHLLFFIFVHQIWFPEDSWIFHFFICFLFLPFLVYLAFLLLIFWILVVITFPFWSYIKSITDLRDCIAVLLLE